MSRQLIFSTCIKNSERLQQACERLRTKGLDVPNPSRVEGYYTRRGDRVSGWAVKLPGWNSQVVLPCDGSHEMYADNYSDYYDERPINPETGARDDNAVDPKTGKPYTVHPRVKSGEKAVGADGRWGDIAHFHSLNQEYAQLTLESVMTSHGGTLAHESQHEGYKEVVFDLPG